ncbi:MAG: DUF3768 domain-containing protein [Hyphomicrobiaceae bacterium]
MRIDTPRIRADNDAFRIDNAGAGRWVISQGISVMPVELADIIAKVRAYREFDEADGPPEHDFGAFDHDGQRIFWKIDVMDRTYTSASHDPTDPRKTRRLLTVMLASEY